MQERIDRLSEKINKLENTLLDVAYFLRQYETKQDANLMIKEIQEAIIKGVKQ